MDLSGVLGETGVAPDVIARLLAAVGQPGVLDTDEAPASSPRQLVLQCALVSVRDLKQNGDALLTLLDWLAPALDELSGYDLGRYWHLRGIAAMRLGRASAGGPHRFSAAARALNLSTQALVAEATPRAGQYLARVHDSFAQILHQQGLLTDALEELERSQAHRDAADHYGLAITHGNLGRLWMDLGDFRQARVHLARDLELLEAVGDQLPAVRAQLLSHVGRCHVHLGELPEAQQAYERSRQLAEKSGDVAARTFATIGLGVVALRQGDARAAVAVSAGLLERLPATTTPERNQRELLAAAHKLAGEAQLACGLVEESVASFGAALRLLDETSSASPMEHAEVHRGIALALNARGMHADAAYHLRRALQQLDKTAADAVRREVEVELQRASRDSWLLHAAGRFVGQQHIEFLLDEGGKRGFRGSELREVVLFSDLRGFTSISERLAPEDVVSFLNDYLSHMTRCIERHGGRVDKFIGDAVMAVFPTSDGSTQTGALDAALAMHDELDRFNRMRSGRLPALSMGIGIHAGKVVAGLIGSPQKREYTVIGDTVNTASRLESLTKQLGATTIASSAVLGAEPNQRFLLRPLGRYAPKGRKDGLELFDVAGERDGSPAMRRLAMEISRAESAHAAFSKREFEVAAAAFTELARDTAATLRAAGYDLLARHAHRFVDDPPPDDWRGQIVLADK